MSFKIDGNLETCSENSYRSQRGRIFSDSMINVFQKSESVNQIIISNAERAVTAIIPGKMKLLSKIMLAKWIIRILILFTRAFAFRLILKIIFGRISLVTLLQQPPLAESIRFAAGTTSISLLFTMTRTLLGFIQKMLKVKFETVELVISGAIASLGMLLFNKKDLPALKTVIFMRAV